MYPVGIVTSSASTVSSQSSTESIPVTVYMLASAPLGPDSVTPLGKPVAVMSIVGVIGTVIVIIVTLGLLFNSNPIVGILGIVVAYLLIERSNQQMKNKSSVATVMEKEMEKMDTFFKVENQFPKTLEEEVVEKRTLHKSKRDITGPSYKPLLSELPGSTLL